MRLMEEPVRQQAPFTSLGAAVSFNQSMRDEIAAQTAEFLKRGGKIDCGKPTHNTLEPPAFESDLQRTMKEKKRKRAQSSAASKVFVQSPISYMDGKNRCNGKAASGHQNIYSSVLKDGRTAYRISVGSTHVGVIYDDLPCAIAKRDAFRKSNNLGPALY